MDNEEMELQRIAEQSMSTDAPPQADAMEAFNLLAGMNNMEAQGINKSFDNSGNRDTMISPINSNTPSIDGGGSFNDPAVVEELIRQETIKASQEAGLNPENVYQQPQQPVVSTLPHITQPTPQPQPHPTPQPMPQQYGGGGVVIPPNLENIILTKIVAIEKTYAKVVEQQKTILDTQVKILEHLKNGS